MWRTSWSHFDIMQADLSSISTANRLPTFKLTKFIHNRSTRMVTSSNTQIFLIRPVFNHESQLTRTFVLLQPAYSSLMSLSALFGGGWGPYHLGLPNQ